MILHKTCDGVSTGFRWSEHPCATPRALRQRELIARVHGDGEVETLVRVEFGGFRVALIEIASCKSEDDDGGDVYCSLSDINEARRRIP